MTKTGKQLDAEIADALSQEIVYRGWRITPFAGTQIGHKLPGSRSLSAQLGFGTHRKIKGYEVHYPDRDGIKVVSTLKAARAYIDDYLGPDA